MRNRKDAAKHSAAREQNSNKGKAENEGGSTMRNKKDAAKDLIAEEQNVKSDKAENEGGSTDDKAESENLVSFNFLHLFSSHDFSLYHTYAKHLVK